MRSIRMLSAAILAASGLIAVGVTTEAAHAADAKDLTVTYTKVMKYETFTAGGTLSTHVARPVQLQYRYGTTGAWTVKASKTTNANGSFSFTGLATTKTRYWRYYAPKSGSLVSIKGNPRKVSVVSQSGSAYISPSQLTYFCAAPGVNETVYAVAAFSPVRPGRTVSFTSPNGSTISGVQDSNGRVVLPFNITKPAGTYNIVVTTASFHGASAASAAPTSIKVNHYSFLCP